MSSITKVELSQYNHKKDLDNRALLSSLNALEVEILKEIAYSSLKFSLKELMDTLSVDTTVIDPLIQRLTEIGLLKVDGTTVIVDKEMRRTFEFQLSKFECDFEPNMDYVLTLLQQVPIHILPEWYALPKNTDDIFSSIIEKLLSTPKIYSKYLQDLVFENAKQEAIITDLFAAEDLSLKASLIKKKYQMSEREFLECMLYLEYSLAAFCIFSETENGFEEMVVPLQEWKNWLDFHSGTHCKPLKAESVERDHPSDFGFVEEVSKTLTSLEKGIRSNLFEKLAALSFVEDRGGKTKATPIALEWASKKPEEQGMLLYLHRMNKLRREGGDKYTDKDIREIEKSLKRVLKTGWVLFDDFFKGISAHIGETEPVALRKKGKRWSYAIPSYSDADKAFITDTVMNFMSETGMVATGSYKGKPCFTITPFGNMTMGE